MKKEEIDNNHVIKIEYRGLSFEIDVYPEVDIILLDPELLDTLWEGINNVETQKTNLFFSKMIKNWNKIQNIKIHND